MRHTGRVTAMKSSTSGWCWNDLNPLVSTRSVTCWERRTFCLVQDESRGRQGEETAASPRNNSDNILFIPPPLVDWFYIYRSSGPLERVFLISSFPYAHSRMCLHWSLDVVVRANSRLIISWNREKTPPNPPGALLMVVVFFLFFFFFFLFNFSF